MHDSTTGRIGIELRKLGRRWSRRRVDDIGSNGGRVHVGDLLILVIVGLVSIWQRPVACLGHLVGLAILGTLLLTHLDRRLNVTHRTEKFDLIRLGQTVSHRVVSETSAISVDQRAIEAHELLESAVGVGVKAQGVDQ